MRLNLALFFPYIDLVINLTIVTQKKSIAFMQLTLNYLRFYTIPNSAIKLCSQVNCWW